MAFGKPDPKDIIGMSAEDLAAKLGKIDEFESKLTDFGNKSIENHNSLIAKLDSLAPKPKMEPETSGDPAVDFLADPINSMDSRLKPLHDQTNANTIMLQHDAARRGNPRDFDRWGTEIVKKMGELSADQQADPRVWKAMILMVRGEHADQIEKDGATGQFGFLEPVSAGLRPDPKSSDNLAPSEREMVRTLSGLGPKGMTAEKYKNGKERLVASRAARLGRFAQVEG
jgi:hypothetical protein